MAMILKAAGPAQGAMWVRDGLRLYLRRPLAFTGLFALFLLVALLVSLLPLVGGVLQIMIVPLLSLGFMVASQSALLQGPVTPLQFVEPFKGPQAQRRALLMLCAGYGIAVVAVLFIADAVADGGLARLLDVMREMQAQGAAGGAPPKEMDVLLASRSLTSGVLVLTALLSAISIPFWHAPALVHWGRQGAGQALFSSTLAVWRCRGAFLVYALAWTGLFVAFAVLATLLFSLLGMRGLAPLLALPAGLFFSTLFYVSLIFSFNDSFAQAPPALPPAASPTPDVLH